MKTPETKPTDGPPFALSTGSANWGALIARKIFECGDETRSPCKRIAFKGGSWPDAERDQGGIGEVPLATLIATVIAEHNSPNVRISDRPNNQKTS